MIVDAVPDCLKYAIGAGIGLFIALIGFKDAGFVVNNPGGLIQLGDFHQPAVWVSLTGLFLTLILLLKRVKGAILIGILGTTLLALILKLIHFEGIVSLPPSLRPTLFKFDLWGALRLDPIIILVLLFMVMFDTIGTLIGVGNQAGLLKNGKLPRSTQALFADAAGTTIGASLGTSTMVCYIESASGVREGGRTGLTAFFVGLFFLAAIFFSPLAKLIGGGIPLPDGHVIHPITAPALILVGSMMMKGIRQIEWDNEAQAIPSFLVLAGIPFTFSIADGLSLGFISYPVAQWVKGQRAPFLTWVLALFFILRYIFA
jgi:AGZA family xanthine/uracil permease-like MFS transporter